MIERETIDKVLDAANIVDVVGDFVSLRRRGANYIACCPFHDEKTPSFSVSPTKGIYKCFGCGKAGNAVSFVMEHEQMTFVEAVKYLGKKYGIDVNEAEDDAEAAAERLRHESMLLVSEYAQKFYQDTLFNTVAGRTIGLSYFREKRGFSDETIRKFGLGYSPDGDSSRNPDGTKSLAETALAAGYKKEFLIATGLCHERGTSGKLYDKFYDRVMFPIHSVSGRVIALGGRTLSADKTVAKYVNSPESEIYHKSSSLYGIFQAKAAISKMKKCYLVEGYADVISMSQAGIENVVASSGTSLTTGQIRLIRRFTSNVTVLYDGDAAGIKASIRGIDMLLEEDMVVKIVLLPKGQDPDDYARTHTCDEMMEFLNTSETDFIDFKSSLLAEDSGNDPIKRAEFVREIIHTISIIPDAITRQVYIERCAKKMEMDQALLSREVAKSRRKILEAKAVEKEREKMREERRETDAEAGTEGVSDIDDIHTDADTVPFLAPLEKEILYYILKYGEYKLYFDANLTYGKDNLPDITVFQYIKGQLDEDGLEIQNALYKSMFDMYASLSTDTNREDDEAKAQERISRVFINCPDQTISQAALKILVRKYNITIKKFNESLTPEENLLGTLVPKVVILYKTKIIDREYKNTCRLLGDAQTAGDSDKQAELMETVQNLMALKKMLADELKKF